MKQHVIIIILILTASMAAAEPATTPDPAATLILAAAGRQTAEFTISAPGRFAVTAESLHGTAIQIVDRVSGPGPVHGEPGKSDGRADRFFEPEKTRHLLEDFLVVFTFIKVAFYVIYFVESFLEAAHFLFKRDRGVDFRIFDFRFRAVRFSRFARRRFCR